VAGICPDSAVQTNFIDYDSDKYEKRRRLDEVIDRIIRNRPRFFRGFLEQ
jgi:DNA polymerase V